MPAHVPPSDEVREQHVRNLMHLLDGWVTAYRDGGVDAIGPAAAILEAFPRTDLVLMVVAGVCALGTAQRVLHDIDPDLLEAVNLAIQAEAR